MFLCAFQFLALPNKATAGHVVVESCDTFECQNTCSLKGDDFSLITQRKLVFSRASYISSSSGWIHFVVVSLALWEWNKGDQRCSEEMTDTCWWWQQAWSGINVISLVAIGLWTTGIDRSNRQHLLFFFFSRCICSPFLSWVPFFIIITVTIFVLLCVTQRARNVVVASQTCWLVCTVSIHCK